MSLISYSFLCYTHITDPLLLEGTLQEMNETLKILQDILEKQEMLLQELLNRVEESEQKTSYRALEKATEPNSSDVYNHLLEHFHNHSYSPSPLPPPLQH